MARTRRVTTRAVDLRRRHDDKELELGDSSGQMPGQSRADHAAGGAGPGTRSGDVDALARAFEAQHRASAVGFDWEEPAGALDKVFEEAREVAALLAVGGEKASGQPGVGDRGGGEARAGAGGAAAGGATAGFRAAAEVRAAVRAELGDLLFAVVNLARLASVDPSKALDQATRKFQARFREVERLAQARGLPMPGTALELLDRIWDEVKDREREGLQSYFHDPGRDGRKRG